jgi:hypothetical protein
LLSGSLRLWSLSNPSEHNLGLICTTDGLFIGRTPLIERRAERYVIRAASDPDRLFKRLPLGVEPDRLLTGLAVVKSALDEDNLCLAQIAALRLRLPDLPDLLAPATLETEDLLIKVDRGDDILARGGWDPDAHPRAGVPPNPGWFAPTGGASPAGSMQVAEGAPRTMPHPALTPARDRGNTGSPIQPVSVRSTGNPDYAARALQMDRNELSRALHELKRAAGLAPDDNVRIMVPSGDVYFRSEYIGNLRSW